MAQYTERDCVVQTTCQEAPDTGQASPDAVRPGVQIGGDCSDAMYRRSTSEVLGDRPAASLGMALALALPSIRSMAAG